MEDYKKIIEKELREIKGFPNYLFNADTGEIISKLRRNTHLKIRHQFQKTTPAVQMIQDGKRRWIIDSDTSQVTELSVSMMGLMRKVRNKLQVERPLGLINETASNSLPPHTCRY